MLRNNYIDVVSLYNYMIFTSIDWYLIIITPML